MSSMSADRSVWWWASFQPPSGRRQTLLSKSLSYFGVDATYAASTAILRRILSQEVSTLRAMGKE